MYIGSLMVVFGFSSPEVRIRRFAVGLLALAALAAAGFLLTRRRPSLVTAQGGKARPPVDDLYAAGL